MRGPVRRRGFHFRRGNHSLGLGTACWSTRAARWNPLEPIGACTNEFAVPARYCLSPAVGAVSGSNPVMSAKVALPGVYEFTDRDWLEFPDDGHPYEILDEELLMTALPSIDHRRISRELEAQLLAYLRRQSEPTRSSLRCFPIFSSPSPKSSSRPKSRRRAARYVADQVRTLGQRAGHHIP